MQGLRNPVVRGCCSCTQTVSFQQITFHNWFPRLQYSSSFSHTLLKCCAVLAYGPQEVRTGVHFKVLTWGLACQSSVPGSAWGQPFSIFRLATRQFSAHVQLSHRYAICYDCDTIQACTVDISEVFFQNLINLFIGYFDPISIFFDNINK